MERIRLRKIQHTVKVRVKLSPFGVSVIVGYGSRVLPVVRMHHSNSPSIAMRKTVFGGKKDPSATLALRQLVCLGHARQRGPGERANAELKNWRVLRKIRSCPRRAHDLLAAVQALMIASA